MKSVMGVLVAGLILGGAVVNATAPGQGRGRSQAPDRKPDQGQAQTRPGQVNVIFSDRDTRLIRTHYGNRFSNLPPGLQKKLARGGSLPPGWQKKMEPFPSVLERQLVVLAPNRRYGIYDGHAVIYDPLTHAILDIVSLF